MSVKILGVTVGLPVVAVASYLIVKNLSKPTISTNVKVPATKPIRTTRPTPAPTPAPAPAPAPTKINPVKMMSLTVDLSRLNEQDINLINSMLTNPDGYDMTYTIKGHTAWNATYVPNRLKNSSVGMNIPSNTAKRLQVYAHVNNPNQPHFDFNARNRGEIGKESLISGGVYQVRDGRGNLGNTTAAILEFTFGDGRKLRISMGHQETKVTDKYGGSGKMSIQHFYGPNTNNFVRNNTVYLKLPDGTSRMF